MSAHLLVVDDEQSILDFLQMMLEEESYRVTTADSVSLARSALANDSFDLVLCDIMMPQRTRSAAGDLQDRLAGLRHHDDRLHLDAQRQR